MKNIEAKQLKKLRILSDQFDVMKEDAIQSFPNECCGFFYGKEGSKLDVIEVQPVRNSKDGDQSRRFEIAPLDYMRAERFAAENALQLLGVYHSHPNHPAIPSEHDLKQALPNFSYIILSIRDHAFEDIRSWRLNEEGEFKEEFIVNH